MPTAINRNTFLVFLFFSSYFILGYTITTDYGISWDEFQQRRYGLFSFDYIVKALNLDIPLYFPDFNLLTAAGRQYPVLFSLTAAAFERFLNIGEADYYAQTLLRHRMLFFLFWLASISFYKLLQLRINNVALALGGTLLLVLTPRIFAHSFFNTKDIVLLSFYIISIYSMVLYLKNPGYFKGFLLGLSCAFVVNTRMAGLIVPLLVFPFGFYEIFRFRKQKQKRNILWSSLLIFFITFSIFSVMFFPFLWENFQQNSIEAFTLVANFPKQFQLLLFKHYISSSPPPFSYPYIWMAITLPPIYLLLIIAGILLFLKRQWFNFRQFQCWDSTNSLIDVVLFLFFAGPLFAVAIFSSTLYDGWRHLYFIYPPVLALGIIALQQILQKSTLLKFMTIGLLFLSCSYTAFFMIKNHPHQQVYFNVFAGKNRLASFEMDYWGLSYKQAFEELVRRNKSADIIQVYCANTPCVDNYSALPKAIQSKIKLRWGIEVADYYMTNYRFRGELQKYLTKKFPFKDEYFSIDADGDKILGVYRLHSE